ncbi:MAG: hypothetical protein R3E53_18835 [Myxococcota bacterium]
MSKPPVDPVRLRPDRPVEARTSTSWRGSAGSGPVCRPTEGVVLTTRYEDTALGFRDNKTFSAVGDMRAPGVVVPSTRASWASSIRPTTPASAA